MTRTLPLLLLFTLFLLPDFGCRKNDDSPVFDIDIEDEFYVDIMEVLLHSSRFLDLKVQTIQKKACQNASLTYSYERYGNTYYVSLNDLNDPLDCIADSSQIQAIIPLNEFQPGTYNLHINLKEEIINKGKLRVTVDYYQLDMETDFGISVVHPRLYRVAPNSIWGHVAFQEAADASLADQFMNELKGISKPINASAGYYGLFSINENTFLPELHYQIDETFHQAFYLAYEEDEVTLIDLVERYRATYPGKLDIKIFTSKGKSL